MGGVVVVPSVSGCGGVVVATSTAVVAVVSSVQPCWFRVVLTGGMIISLLPTPEIRFDSIRSSRMKNWSERNEEITETARGGGGCLFSRSCTLFVVDDALSQNMIRRKNCGGT